MSLPRYFLLLSLSLSLNLPCGIESMERQGKKNEDGILSSSPQRMLPKPSPSVRLPVSDEVRLAVLAVDLNVRLRSSDMPATMQARAIRFTRALLGSNPVDKNRSVSPTRLAMCLKKEFDMTYGPAWHCVAGKSFGSFVTHSTGGFIYFSADNFYLLLFKTHVRPIESAY